MEADDHESLARVRAIERLEVRRYARAVRTLEREHVDDHDAPLARAGANRPSSQARDAKIGARPETGSASAFGCTTPTNAASVPKAEAWTNDRRFIGEE